MTLCRTLHGVGVPDYDYPIRRYKGDKVVWTCPYFQRWSNMIARCYSDNQHKYTPSYNGVRVCDEWLTFSSFKKWMEVQDWDNKELDKDLLGDGTLYSPETCCFISKQLNLKLRKFLYEGSMGVSWHKQRNRFRAYTYDHITGKQKHLGLFSCRNSAQYAANIARKIELENLLDSAIITGNIERVLRKRINATDIRVSNDGLQPDHTHLEKPTGTALDPMVYPIDLMG